MAMITIGLPLRLGTLYKVAWLLFSKNLKLCSMSLSGYVLALGLSSNSCRSSFPCLQIHMHKSNNALMPTDMKGIGAVLIVFSNHICFPCH